jgi:hypothetical protein
MIDSLRAYAGGSCKYPTRLRSFSKHLQNIFVEHPLTFLQQASPSSTTTMQDSREEQSPNMTEENSIT